MTLKQTRQAAVPMLALALAIQSAYAQAPAADKDKSAAQLETVVVTGIRKSLEDSARKKREANQIKEAISAEDIGKLPDNNVAEALQRVTGIQIGRDDGGEGNSFQVRGLSQNRVEIDGRSVLSGNPDNRSPSLNNISSQLFQGIEVLKSPSAMDVEGSLGATVKLVSRKPLDTQPKTLSMRLQGQNSSLRGGAMDPTLSVMGSHRWNLDNGGRMGVLVAVAYDKYSQMTDQLQNSGWGEMTTTLPTAGQTAAQRTAVLTASQVVNPTGSANNAAGAYTLTYPGLTGYNKVFRPLVMRIQQFDLSRERRGLDMAFQLKPNDNWLFTLTGNHNRYESQNNQQKIAFNLNSTPQYYTPGPFTDGLFTTGRDAVGAETAAQKFGFILASRVAVKDGQPGFDFVRVNPTKPLETNEQNNVAFKTEYTGDVFDVTANFAMGRGRNGSLDNNNNFSLPSGATTRQKVFVDYDFRNSVNGPANIAINLPAPYTLSDGSNWLLSNFTPAFTTRRAREDELRIDATAHVDWGVLKDVRFGFRGSEGNTSRMNVGQSSPDGTGLPISAIPQFKDRIALMDNPIFERFGSTLPNGWFTVVNMSNTEYEALRQEIQKNAVLLPESIFNRFAIQENRYAGYLQGDFEGRLGGVAYRGNAGVRFLTALTTIDAVANVGGRPQPITQYNKMTRTLPAANIAFELTKSDVVRVAGAKVLAFPNPSQLSPAVVIGGNSTEATAGNPDLKPFEATQFDLSAEHYWGRSNLVSLALFTKKVGAFTINERVGSYAFDRNGNGTIDPTGVLDPDDFITINRPTNGQSGKIKGVEVGLQSTFDFLPGFLSGFGASVNYTYTKSSQPAQSYDLITGKVLPLPQLSPKSFNFALFYEKYGLSTRFAYNQRDAYFDGNDGVLARWVDKYGQWDWNIAYQITPKISVFGGIVNLNGETRRSYSGIREAMDDFRDTGKRYTLGMSWAL